MKQVFVLAVLPLVCSASAAAFIYPASATTGPGQGSDVSSAIAPLRQRQLQQQQQQQQQHKQQQLRRNRRLVASLGGGIPEAAGVVVSLASSVLSWLVGAIMSASIIHYVQGLPYRDLGLTPDKILGVPAEQATADDVAKLGKAEFMQLFYASKCPAAGDLDGEYRARTLEMGILHPAASIITHRIWGPGRWLGKAIGAGSQEGYNIFSHTSTPPIPPSSLSPSPVGSMSLSEKKEDGGGVSGGSSLYVELPSDTRRGRCFRFSQFSESVFDRGESSRMDYSSARSGKNGPLFGGMRDEVRKVNDRLFVGLGYIQAFGGKYNSAPFVMEGPPVKKFTGPDKPEQ